MAQSTHKTLGSLTQSAMLHTGRGARERGVDASRVSSALSALQSSSPSYLLMASLDAARCQLAEAGPDLFAAALQVRCHDGPTKNSPGIEPYHRPLTFNSFCVTQAAAEARAGLRDLGAEVLDVASAGPGSHCVGWDHLRLTVTPPGTFHASGAFRCRALCAGGVSWCWREAPQCSGHMQVLRWQLCWTTGLGWCPR